MEATVTADVAAWEGCFAVLLSVWDARDRRYAHSRTTYNDASAAMVRLNRAMEARAADCGDDRPGVTKCSCEQQLLTIAAAWTQKGRKA